MNQIHGTDHFQKSKGLLPHACDNHRRRNDQMTEDKYGSHTEWGKENRGARERKFWYYHQGRFIGHQMSSPHAIS